MRGKHFGPLLLLALALSGTDARSALPRERVSPVALGPCHDASSCASQAYSAATPRRVILDVLVSREERVFAVWSKPRGLPREIDIFVVPEHDEVPLRTAHLAPGFGGDLAWLRGDTLWHWYGCGSSCVRGTLYNREGRVLFRAQGALQSVRPDGGYLAVASQDGVSLVSALDGTLVATARMAPEAVPLDVVWEGERVAIDYHAATGSTGIVCDLGASNVGCRRVE